MKQEISMNWLEDMAFETEVNGHKIYLDAYENVGGKDRGPRPKPLMMVALAGCTGMDVVSILKKMKIELDSFNIGIEAELDDEYPKPYTSMKIIYTFKGKDLPKSKIEKAVNLSQDKYCGVSENYRKAMKLDFEIRINE
ncbi:MAG: OsmC family protein [Bacteroidota bacterium]